jgi:type IV pilus assembly protein PilB
MKILPQDWKKILVESKYIKEEDFERAIKISEDLDREISDVLLFRGLVDEKTLGELAAKYLGVEFVDLDRKIVSLEVLNMVPEKMAYMYRMMPFEADEKTLSLAMEDPRDLEALEFVKRKTDLEVKIFLTPQAKLNRALIQYKKNIKEVFEEIIKKNLKKTEEAKTEQDLARIAGDLPVIQILDTILQYAVAERASDVHIELLASEVVVRFRVDGVLRDIISLPKKIQSGIVARVKVLSDLKLDEHRIPQDGRFKFKVQEEYIALRVSVLPAFYGENVVMRILFESSRPLNLTELGLTGRNLELVQEGLKEPNGMILVTGPTGCGKTTTLYSAMNIINDIGVKICTIEDPIEYGMKRVTQTQVNTKTGLSFALGLRSLMRHDPDIIMVGEIRDQETAKIAVNAALTGHLVLSTLHTNDAPSTVPRFLDMGVEAFLLTSTLNLVLAQRLVRKICPSCVAEYKPSEEEKKVLEDRSGQDLSKIKLYRGKGCDECGGSGYRGRFGIFEVFKMSDKIRELVLARSSVEKVRKQAIEDGMIEMFSDGLDKVSAGLTTIEEIIRAAGE